MKAIILAAGIASRLRPLTDHKPKCLLQVGNKNILSLTLDNIIANNIKEVIIVTGYREQQIKDFISDNYNQLVVTYIFNDVYDSTNNIYSLWLAKDELIGHDMLLMDSDIIFDAKILTSLIESGFDNCLALKKHQVHEEEIKCRVDQQGRILEIGKEVIPDQAIGESIGIEKFSADLVDKLFQVLERKMLIEKTVNQFYEAAFQELIDKGEEIYVTDVTDKICMEIDTAHDLELANQLMSKSE
jgi:choline kinase